MYMRGVERMKNDSEKCVQPLLSYFNEYCGMEITEPMVRKEFTARPLFTVQEQIEAMENPQKLPKWINGVANFMKEQGRISQKEYDRYVKANYFIDPSFMKKLAEKRAASGK